MTDETDFIVVGTGIGGLTAAITAADAGLRVLLLERSPLLGGVLAVTQGEVWVAGTDLEREAGIEDSPQLADEYLEAISGGFADPAMRARLLATAPNAVKFLREHAGVRWRVCRGLPDYYFGMMPGTLAEGRYLEVEPLAGAELGPWRDSIRDSPFFPNGITHEEMYGWGSISSMHKWDWELVARRKADDIRSLGPGLAAYLVKAALVDRRIPIETGARVTSLVTDDQGRVTGVRYRTGDGEVVTSATRGVLLATGGYEWNPKHTRNYEQLPEYNTLCPPIVTGDGMDMAVDVGAQVVSLPPIGQASVFGYRIPGEMFEGEPLWRLGLEAGLPHSIVVNRSGRRFCDESFYRDHQSKFREFDNKTQRYTNLPAYLIFDQTFRDRYPLGPAMPGQPLPEGLVTRADSIPALAAAIRVDPAGLEETVGAFNKHVADGHDPDFGRGESRFSNVFVGDLTYDNPNLGVVESAPFYALELGVGGCGINAAGLSIDLDARVQHRHGGPIPGLYASGNTAGMTDIGLGINSGFANARGMTWGYLAAEHAAAQHTAAR